MKPSILVRKSCPYCKGRGELEVKVPYCCKCHAKIPHDHSWWKNADDPFRLPCGHSIKYLIDDLKFCHFCEGTGTAEEWVSLPKLAEMLREEASDD